jgi:spore germination protein YaaH
MGMTASRWGLVALALLVVVLLPAAGQRAVQTRTAAGPVESPAPLGPAHLAQVPDSKLDPAPQPPQALPPTLTTGAALRSHEVFAFAPYWTLGSQTSFQVKDLTTVAYFGVDVQPDGSLLRDGTGWSGYQSKAWADLVTRAHASGTRAVLTAKSFDNGTLHALAGSPGAADRLAADLTQAVRQGHLDGANLDFEGTAGSDRDGFTRFLTQVAAQLHAANPHWQVTADTFASSANDPAGLLDVTALGKAVDAIFVMGYDLNRSGLASGLSPLGGSGQTIQSSIDGYAAATSPGKVILGVPFYGYDWPTDTGRPGAATTGGPTALGYGQVKQLSGTHHWDAAASEPWISYQSNGSWHEVYYEDPRSLGMKAQLADSKGLRGLGFWALGMDGGDPALIAALAGKHPPIKLPPPVASRTTTTSHAPSTTTQLAPPPAGTTLPPPASAPRTTPTPAPIGTTPTPTPTPTPSPTPSPSPSTKASAGPNPGASPSPSHSP